MSIMNLPATLWSIGRRFETLLASQDKTTEVLEAFAERLRSLEDRMIRLEATREPMIVEAKAAASAAAYTAATGVVTAALSDIFTRLTRIEIRLGDDAARLPPPASGP